MKTIYIKYGEKIDNIGPISICLGYFDGIHQGHRKLILKALECKEKVAFLTFDKSPSDVYKGIESPILTSIEDKEEILEKLHVDYLVCLKNDKALLDVSPSDFIDNILLPLGVKNVICGFDYHFGKNRVGDYSFLKEYGGQSFNNFKVDEVVFEGKKISSTLIRELILNGEIEKANYLLEKDYTIKGEVIKGNQIGRKLNFPTINIEMKHNYLLPPNGVYASLVFIDGIKYYSVTNVGVHPTVGASNRILIESYIFDFSQEIYGKSVSLSFKKFIRHERDFSSSNELKKQISKDAIDVKDYFSNF